MACANPQAPASLSALNQTRRSFSLWIAAKTLNQRSKSVCFLGNLQAPGAASSQSLKLITCGKKVFFGFSSPSGGRYFSRADLTPMRGPAVLKTTKGRCPVCLAQSQIPLANCSRAEASGVIAQAIGPSCGVIWGNGADMKTWVSLGSFELI